MNNKVYGSEDLCRFCEEEEETFNHIINECPCFYLDRCNLLQNQPIINTLEWDPEILLKFANIDTKQSNMQYIKICSDSQAAILALNSNTVTSSSVKQTIITLNLLAGSTERLEICWIKAHVGYDGNERADQLAREAVKNSQVGVNTPQSWACYKAQLK